MKFTKKGIYIGLFAILYLIVAFSSFWHAIAFFGLANNAWMSIILAFAFEVGQAAVLFSLLTSKKDRSRIMPWVLMFMFTLVQVIGNVFSSYKYLITNSSENLRYFKEPIFIWTDLPNDQTTVIITYIVGAILPIAALLLTSMITNYLSDNDEEQQIKLAHLETENGPENQPIIINNKEDFDKIYNDEKEPRINTEESKSDNDAGKQPVDTIESEEISKSTITEDPKQEDNEIPANSDTGTIKESGLETDKSGDGNDDLENKKCDNEITSDNIDEVTNDNVKQSHFINL